MITSYRWENLTTQRYYKVILTQDLFGDWVVTKVWGGFRKAGGGSKNIPCQSYEECLKLIQKIALLRLKRGYIQINT